MLTFFVRKEDYSTQKFLGCMSMNGVWDSSTLLQLATFAIFEFAIHPVRYPAAFHVELVLVLSEYN